MARPGADHLDTALHAHRRIVVAHLGDPGRRGVFALGRDRRKAGKCVLEGEHLVSVYGERHGAPETLVVTDAAMTHALVRRLVDR